MKNTAMRIRSLRKPNIYTGQGILLAGETVRLKARKGRGKAVTPK